MQKIICMKLNFFLYNYFIVQSDQDCWAYDSEYFEDSSTTKVQLTTRDGCPV